MLMQDRIVNAVYRHLNYSRHPVILYLPERDYEMLLDEIRQLIRWESIDTFINAIEHNRLTMECPHGPLKIRKRKGRNTVWWKWRCREDIQMEINKLAVFYRCGLIDLPRLIPLPSLR